jgi:hypothetical protein
MSKQKVGQQIIFPLLFCCSIRDPKSRIGEPVWKKTGFGTKILDPQYWKKRSIADT